MLEEARAPALKERNSAIIAVIADMYLAADKTRSGDLDAAISLARGAVEEEFESGDMVFLGWAVTILVDALLRRGTPADLSEAEAATARLAGVPTESDFVLNRLQLLRLRALLARAKGDEATHREFADCYREMAKSLGFEGHIALAEAMT